MTPNEFTAAVKHAAEVALDPLKICVEFRNADAWKFGEHGHVARFVAYKKDGPEPAQVIAESLINVRDTEAKSAGANFLALFVVRAVLEGCVKIHRDRLTSVAFHWQKIEDLIGISPKPENNHAEQKSRRRENQSRC